MKPRLHILTLAVTDLEESLRFYRDGLGWPTKGIVGEEFKGDESTPSGRAAFFNLENGLIFALYPDLPKDANRSRGEGIEFSMGYLVSNKDEVDVILGRAQMAGATITEQPYDRPWGIYSGYFQDLDGHSWEIIYNPQMLPD
jgi:hypothetical protein